MGEAELMSPRAHWQEPGYGDIETSTRNDDHVEVVFGNGDIVCFNPRTLGVTGDFTADVAEGGAAVLLGSADGDREVDWMIVRSASDPAFAQELRERDAEEARRVGRRLRALRENNGMSQKTVATVVGMTSPQLAKLEQGETDMRVSTLRSLLRALGAGFADIAGPGAPEISVRELTKRAQLVGIPADILKRIASVVGPRQFAEVLARAFRWEARDLPFGALRAPTPVTAPMLKRRRGVGTDSQALLALAEALAQLSARGYPGSPGVVPADARSLRRAIVGDRAEITLEDLLDWCWRAGIVIVPMEAAGGFSAGAWIFDGQPAVVLKEAPDYKAYWLFALAHELGHLAQGHVRAGGLIDIDSAWKEGDGDAQEDEANAYALDLLLPDHVQMLEEIRRQARGSRENVLFKFKAMDAATARGYSAPLVLLVAAFGLPDIARPGDRWGSANNEAKREGSARAVVAERFAQNVDLAHWNLLMLCSSAPWP
jgi:transcriptional regulator with XRE-family HTH domain